MSEVLYRQYRPQTFAEVVNQQAIKKTLQNAVAGKAIAHAYLFTGPRGVGKTSFARILAKAVNCLNSPPTPSLEKEGVTAGDACNACDTCNAIREGRFLDLIEIDAASNTGVDNVRELIEHVKFSPSQGRYKVIVIDEVHMLSKGAFNALLKTLEEPPAHALFILATTEIAKVPTTIVSRTQRFDFKRLSQADIIGHLQDIAKKEKIKAPQPVLQLVARASDGSMRDALSLFDQLISFSEGALTLEEAEQILGLSPFGINQDFFEFLSSHNLPGGIKLVADLSGQGRDIQQFLNGFLEYLQMLLSQKIRGEAGDRWGLAEEDYKRLVAQAGGMSQQDLVRLIDIFLVAAQKLKFSPIPELPLQLAAVEFIEVYNQESPRPTAIHVQTSAPAPAVSSAVIDQQKPRAPADSPQTISTPPASAPPDNRIAEISQRWNEALSKLREYNHSLISSLKLATLVSCSDGSLTLAFPYRFHKEAVEQRKNRLVIEKVLEEVYGLSLRLVCVMTHDLPITPTPPTLDVFTEPQPAASGRGLLEEAMKVFGVSDGG